MVSIKLSFGLSYLSLPHTFSTGGIVGGALMLSLVVTLNIITMMQVLRVAKENPHVKTLGDLGF